MALSGSTISWAESAPAGAESIGLGDNRIRSMKTDLRTALDSEHVWPSTGGVAGQHRAGSARAFYGAQSAVSASDTSNVADGRMMIASDTSRLFGVNSLGTVLLGGGPRTLSVGSHLGVTFPQRMYLAVEMGTLNVPDTTGVFSTNFPNSGFSAAPQLFLSVSATTVQSLADGVYAWIPIPSGSTSTSNLTAGGFSGLAATRNGSGASGVSIGWLAIGLRTL